MDQWWRHYRIIISSWAIHSIYLFWLMQSSLSHVRPLMTASTLLTFSCITAMSFQMRFILAYISSLSITHLSAQCLMDAILVLHSSQMSDIFLAYPLSNLSLTLLYQLFHLSSQQIYMAYLSFQLLCRTLYFSRSRLYSQIFSMSILSFLLMRLVQLERNQTTLDQSCIVLLACYRSCALILMFSLRNSLISQVFLVYYWNGLNIYFNCLLYSSQRVAFFAIFYADFMSYLIVLSLFQTYSLRIFSVFRFYFYSFSLNYRSSLSKCILMADILSLCSSSSFNFNSLTDSLVQRASVSQRVIFADNSLICECEDDFICCNYSSNAQFQHQICFNLVSCC